MSGTSVSKHNKDMAKNVIGIEKKHKEPEKLDIKQILRKEHWKECPVIAEKFESCVKNNNGVVENCWELFVMIRDCTEKIERGSQ
jgi:hypothetical protein